jgi:hypothetical protein
MNNIQTTAVVPVRLTAGVVSELWTVADLVEKTHA